MKKLLLSIILSLLFSSAFSQSDTLRITLFDAIALAAENSFDALIAENEYMAAYWNYKNYQASSLPFLSLHARPTTFNRYISKQFNPLDTTYSYFEEQNLNSYASLSLTQNLPMSGGAIYVDSDFGRLSNFGERQNRQYTATAFRIGLQQPVFSFNQFKWNKKLEPMKYELGQKIYLQRQADVALKALELFFDCLKAELNYTIAINNYNNADSLFKIGSRRFELTSINKSELLSLNLEVVNSKNYLSQAKNLYDRAVQKFLLFLGLEENSLLNFIVPEDIPMLKLDGTQVIDLARKNNPAYLSFRYSELESEMKVDKARNDSRLKATVSASYGLNQQSRTITDLYGNMLDQERFDLTLNIPIVDWGVKRNRYNMASREKEAQMFSVRKQEADLEQDILLTVDEYNLQADLVFSAKEAADIAVEVYDLAMRRFLIGEASVNDLIIHSNRKEVALKNYYNELSAYWRLYYKIMQSTLYDFIHERPLYKDILNKGS